LKNFATEEFVLQNGGILCPGEDCGNGLMLEEGITRRIVCFRSRGGCGVSGIIVDTTSKSRRTTEINVYRIPKKKPLPFENINNCFKT